MTSRRCILLVVSPLTVAAFALNAPARAGGENRHTNQDVFRHTNQDRVPPPPPAFTPPARLPLTPFRFDPDSTGNDPYRSMRGSSDFGFEIDDPKGETTLIDLLILHPHDAISWTEPERSLLAPIESDLSQLAPAMLFGASHSEPLIRVHESLLMSMQGNLDASGVGSGSGSIQINAVPGPGAWPLLAIGLSALAGGRRRRAA